MRQLFASLLGASMVFGVLGASAGAEQEAEVLETQEPTAAFEAIAEHPELTRFYEALTVSGALEQFPAIE